MPDDVCGYALGQSHWWTSNGSCMFCGKMWDVKRVFDATGSHIEPQLEGDWLPIMKLIWHAQVIKYDTGIAIDVVEYPDNFNLLIGKHSLAVASYQTAWDVMTGVALGAEVARTVDRAW